jgi:glycyl-tRNA synthetase beta chain
MREHQRYFPVYDRPGGALLPSFIAVRNGLEDHLDNVRHGNEKVLRPRLSDARFFWDEDRAVPLEERLPALRAVVFHQGLGSQDERTARIVRLAEVVAGALRYDVSTMRRVQRTATLCKCDLLTSMVGEFPELQGVMGREYARAGGEDAEVATGIFEHYLPRGAGDALPATPTGIAVGLADRLNTLAGFFALGLIPTGSADPFALRRAAQGVAAVVVGRALRLHVGSLTDAALDGYDRFDAATRAAAREALREFMRARLEGLLKERGIRYDVVDAVLAAGSDDMCDAVARAEALHAGLGRPDFAAVAAAFKRIANIVDTSHAQEAPPEEPSEQAPGAPPPDVPAEVALWRAFSLLRAEAEALLAAEDYAAFYRLATGLKGPVDTFFVEVLVMDPDPPVRRRRLALLREIAALLTQPADLSRLAVG